MSISRLKLTRDPRDQEGLEWEALEVGYSMGP